MTAVGAITTSTSARGYVTNVIVIATWLALVNLLQNPRWLVLFNELMGLLLVISLYPLLFVESAFS